MMKALAVQQISQGCDDGCCVALLSVENLRSGPSVAAHEKQAAFIGEGLLLKPGKVHRLTFEMVSVTSADDFLGMAPGVRIGVGSVDGSTPGKPKHR